MTFSDMRKAKQILLDNGYNAADIVPALTDTDLQAILAGDFSVLPQAQTDHGTERRKDHPERITDGAKDQQTKHQGERITTATDHHGERSTGSMERGTGSAGRDHLAGSDGDLPTGNGDILEDMTGGGLLPVSLYDDIKDMISLYCKEFNIQDQQKIHPSQWKGICIRLGQSFKARRLLQDKTRYKEVGFCYDGQKVAALLDLYEVVCSDYKQVPFAYNFMHFAGISRQYFADYQERLTSGRVNLRQKAYEIQKAGLTEAITAGGSATVGNIFLGKALAGLQETTTVMHVSASPAISSTELPALPSKS